jgi:transposase-like protein
MVRMFKRKTEDKYDKETLRTAIYEYREEKACLNSVAKKYRMPRTTLQYWLHKDFPPLGLQD